MTNEFTLINSCFNITNARVIRDLELTQDIFDEIKDNRELQVIIRVFREGNSATRIKSDTYAILKKEIKDYNDNIIDGKQIFDIMRDTF